VIWVAPGFREIINDSTTDGLCEVIDRMPAFIGLQVDARAVLAGTRLAIAGVGSVGARVAEHAARCRIGEIDLIDPKPFTANFDTQAIRLPSDIGQPKAGVVGRWIKTISPGSTVRVFDGPVQALSWLDLDRYDIVIASTDNLQVEVYLGAMCLALGKPLLYAAVHGPTLCCQLRVFLNRDSDSPCPFCGFNRVEREQLSNGVRFSCGPDANPGADPQGAIDGPPTVSVSPLCSLAADAAMLELLRLTLGLGPQPTDCLRELNGYGATAMTMPLTRNAACPVDHAILDRVRLDQPLGECSLRDCAKAAGVTGDEGIARASFAVDDCLFARVVTCGACGASQEHNRFMDRREPPLSLACRACGHKGLSPHPFFSHDRLIPAKTGGLLPYLDGSLRALGADGRGVVVRHGGQAVLVQSNPDDQGSTT